MDGFAQVGKIELLPLIDLIKTSEIDQANWNYRFILGKIINQRYKLLLSLIDKIKVENLLEIGYGSGIFFPQLKKYSINVYGIDIHNKNQEVMNRLSRYGIASKLIQGNAANIPMSSKFFDLIIAISSMEFVENIDQGCKEVSRVLKDDGKFIVITPTKSSIADTGLKILTGRSAESDYKGGRNKLMPALLKYFKIEKELTYPKIKSLKLYSGLKLIKK